MVRKKGVEVSVTRLAVFDDLLGDRWSLKLREWPVTDAQGRTHRHRILSLGRGEECMLLNAVKADELSDILDSATEELRKIADGEEA